MRQLLAFALALSALSAPVYSAEKNLADYKAIYEKESARIEQEHREKLSRILAGYGKGLGTIRERFKKAGDLAGILALKKEQERFREENSIPDTTSSDLPALIQKAQSSCRQSVTDAEVERARKLKMLTGSYVKRLDTMKKELVSQEKLDAAIAVDSEIKRVEFVMADIESRLPKAASSELRPSPASAKSPPGPSPARRAGDELILNLGDGVRMQFVWIPPGSFMMGSPDGEKGHEQREEPVHKVTIRKGFWMGKYEVTQEQYGHIMGKNPSVFRGDKNPAEQVSWHNAKSFCEVLTRKIGKTARLPVKVRGEVKTVRLPTEAEWEYACRAGTTTRFYTGDSESGLCRAGWWQGNGGGLTHGAGQKEPNAWGLYDMHGNVWEWSEDWFDEDYYSKSPGTDPCGPEQGSSRVLRGGGWNANANRCRAAFRSRSTPGDGSRHNGFRPVLPLERQ